MVIFSPSQTWICLPIRPQLETFSRQWTSKMDRIIFVRSWTFQSNWPQFLFWHYEEDLHQTTRPWNNSPSHQLHVKKLTNVVYINTIFSHYSKILSAEDLIYKLLQEPFGFSPFNFACCSQHVSLQDQMTGFQCPPTPFVISSKKPFFNYLI